MKPDNFNPYIIRRERHPLITLRTKVPQENGSGFTRVASEMEYSVQLSFQYVPITGGINTEVRLVRSNYLIVITITRPTRKCG